jgi:hypothetical protein
MSYCTPIISICRRTACEIQTFCFYNRAKDDHLYPASETHSGNSVSTYLLTNEREFFAVTASLYLWGNVDREPYNRERLTML